MYDRIAEIRAQYAELTAQLGDPDIASDPKAYRQIVTTQKRLEPIARLAEERESLLEQKEEAELLAEDDDAELAEMAQLELETIKERLEALTDELQLALLPRNPDDDRNCLLEIRAGTGGDEASLFAGDLFRMYQRLVDRTDGWRMEDRVALGERDRRRWIQGDRRRREGRRCLRPPQVREGRASRPARPRDREPGADPHLDLHGRDHARGRGSRPRDQRERPQDRRVPLLRRAVSR